MYRFGLPHGTPLMLLHGNGISALQWSPMVAALSAERSIYTLDLLGHSGGREPGQATTGLSAGFSAGVCVSNRTPSSTTGPRRISRTSRG